MQVFYLLRSVCGLGICVDEGSPGLQHGDPDRVPIRYPDRRGVSRGGPSALGPLNDVAVVNPVSVDCSACVCMVGSLASQNSCGQAFFLGREMPNKKSSMALAAILLSAGFYVATDAEFLMDGFGAYTWISIYFLLICCRLVYFLGWCLFGCSNTGLQCSFRFSLLSHFLATA